MPEHALKTFLQEQIATGIGIRRLVLGFSGGLDSTVMLHALAAVAPALGLPVHAVHVHHGLSLNADDWAEHADRVCRMLGVGLTVCRVSVPEQASLEAAARDARRQALAGCLQPGDVLLLAQHRDDQAETLLFRLLRGSGLAGLGAMKPVSHFPLLAPTPASTQQPVQQSVPQWRPFLTLSRQQLARYATEHGLVWMEDEFNQDTRLDRNYLRHAVFPLLHERWPAGSATFAATALRLQEADSLLQEMAEQMALDAVDERGCLSVSVLRALEGKKLGTARQRLLLRYWLGNRGFSFPDEKRLEKILHEVAFAREDAMPLLAWPGCEIRRYRDALYAMAPLPVIPSGWQRQWRPDVPLLLPDGRYLSAAPVLAGNILLVRYRHGGEHLQHAGHLRELRTLMQAAAIPPWERERLPLVFAGEQLLAVVGTDIRADGVPDMSFCLEG